MSGPLFREGVNGFSIEMICMCRIDRWLCKMWQDCGPHSYSDIGLEEVDGPNLEQSLPLNNDGSQSPYGFLTINGELFCQSLKWDDSTALSQELR
jgi:hypothetical protein